MKKLYTLSVLTLVVFSLFIAASLTYRHHILHKKNGLVIIDKKYCFENRQARGYFPTWNQFTGQCYIDQVQVMSRFLYLEYFKMLNGRYFVIDIPVIDFKTKKAEKIFRPSLKIPVKR